MKIWLFIFSIFNLSTLRALQPPPPTFQFPTGLSATHKKLLTADFIFLKSVFTKELNKVKNRQSQRSLLLQRMDVPLPFPKFDGALIQKYIDQRVNFLINDNEEQRVIEKIRIIDDTAEYPNSDLCSTFFETGMLKEVFNAQTEAVTVASNIGAIYYLIGKCAHLITNSGIQVPSIFGTQINNKNVKINSPRVGILLEGPGLFFNITKNGALDSRHSNSSQVVDRLNRIGTIFHEGRHSDGSGENLGFFHAFCPEDFPVALFRGIPACDSGVNGPYGIGGQLLAEFKEACKKGTICKDARSIGALQAASIDSLSRVLNPSFLQTPSQAEFVSETVPQ